MARLQLKKIQLLFLCMPGVMQPMGGTLFDEINRNLQTFQQQFQKFEQMTKQGKTLEEVALAQRVQAEADRKRQEAFAEAQKAEQKRYELEREQEKAANDELNRRHAVALEEKRRQNKLAKVQELDRLAKARTENKLKKQKDEHERKLQREIAAEKEKEEIRIAAQAEDTKLLEKQRKLRLQIQQEEEEALKRKKELERKEDEERLKRAKQAAEEALQREIEFAKEKAKADAEKDILVFKQTWEEQAEKEKALADLTREKEEADRKFQAEQEEAKRELEERKADKELALKKELAELDAEQKDQDRRHQRKYARLLFDKAQEFLASKKAMGNVAGVVSFSLASYYGYPVLFEYVEQMLVKPTLVERTTRFSLSWAALARAAKKMTGFARMPRMPKVILSPVLAERMSVIARASKNTKKHGGVFNHLLLYGKPGTGKTMWAEQFAQKSGMDFALISGPAFDQFKPGDAVNELKKLFSWARSNKKGTVIFIDEADTFLENRETIAKSKIPVLNEFLTQTGTETGDFMIVFATNRPHVLDAAINTRIGEAIEFSLPTAQEVELMIKQYVEFLITKNPGLAKYGIKFDMSEMLAERMLHDVAERFVKAEFSGRDVMYFVNSLKNEALALDKPRIAHDVIERVVQQRISKKMRENEDEARREQLHQQKLNALYGVAAAAA